jgi:hypothetical protein
MKRTIKFLILLILSTSFYHCDKLLNTKYAAYVKNNSDHSIGCYFSLGGKNGTYYPDTILPASNQYVIREIKPGDRYTYYSGTKWEEIFPSLPKDTMSVYIFHTDTLNKYIWEEIRNNNKILKRYDLSLDDLMQNNMTITYP